MAEASRFIFLGEPSRERNDSCRVFILVMHILYVAWIIPTSEMANQGMVLLQMGDNNAANHGNGDHRAPPPPPLSLAQAIAALIADHNE